MIPANVAQLMIAQVGHEYANMTLYRSLANFFDACALDGFKQYMLNQAEGEKTHAEKFMDELNDRGVTFTIPPIDSPGPWPQTPLEAFKATLQRERETTELIRFIGMAASQSGDFQTLSFLNWFFIEQTEEEKSTGDWVMRLELVGDNTAALFELDEKAAEESEV